MSDLAKKVFELFGKPEPAAEIPLPAPKQDKACPSDTAEKASVSTGEPVRVPQRRGDVLTPWGWYSRLSEEDKRRWEERSSAASSSPMSEPTPWPCQRCGKPAEIEDVCLSLDGTRTLTLWHCEPCRTHGVTPDTLRQPPVWVSKREQ